jgi:hypothetical protein
LTLFLVLSVEKRKTYSRKLFLSAAAAHPDAASDRAERNTGADFTAHHTDMIFQFGYGSGFQCTILRLLPQHTILSEPEFLNLLRSPGIDSQPGGPVRQPLFNVPAARLQKLAESIPRLLKRVQIRALLRYSNRRI